MRWWRILLIASALFAAAFAAFYFLRAHPGGERSGVFNATAWQRMAIPGALSQPHTFLEHNCAACHTSVKGVEAKNCIVCHVDNKSVLSRQPTAFHAEIAECTVCHLEHQGRVSRTTKVDHAGLARIGLRQLTAAAADGQERDALIAWVKTVNEAPHAPQLAPDELLLNCATCHQTKDRHRGLFGADCAQCHATTKWTIAQYRHPPASSQSCSQCHEGPPSHYMMHFKMISMTTAGVEKAEVTQCFLCHQTTSWNDIKGVGWYKHH